MVEYSMLIMIILTLTILWVLYFLYNPIKTNNLDSIASNVELGKQKQKELESDFKNGLIDEESYNEAKEDIISTLAMELNQPQAQKERIYSASVLSTLFIIMFIPILSLWLYNSLGHKSQAEERQQSTSQKAENGKDITFAELEQKLKEHLISKPKDFETLKSMGFLSIEKGDNQKALAYFEMAYKVNPKDLELLIEYASIQAMENNDDFSGKPIQLIEQALKIDPNIPDALYMSSLYVLSYQKYDLAIRLLNKAIMNLPEGSSDIDILKGNITEIEQIKAGNKPIKGVTTSNRIEISLKIKEETMAIRSLEDYLMIYVKSATGRPMPIAIKKIKIKDFQNPIILSDEDSVMPTTKLSKSKDVVVVVRISESGHAMRQEGDMKVKSQIIEKIANNKISLTI